LLEDRLGVRLFERGANRLALTPAGKSYHVGLVPNFDALAGLSEQVSRLPGANVLTVGVGPTFAVRWLIPRLTCFRQAAPDVDLRVTTGGIAAPFTDEWTCGIKLGSGQWSGLVADELFDADLLQVCTVRIGRRLKTVRDLSSATLLSVAHASTDWPAWLKAAGLAKLPIKGPVFDFYGQAQQAAIDGVGIALGLRPYIDDDLAAGRLVAPFKQSVKKDARWYLIYRAERRHDPALKAFRDWLAQETA
jgi:LysR family glycine cleavage system transcriptional activator